MDYLKDEELEKNGLIKEIDTLSIVNKASEIKQKKMTKLYILSFIVLIITAVIGQIIFIKLFGINKKIIIGIGIYIIASVGILLQFFEKGEEYTC